MGLIVPLIFNLIKNRPQETAGFLHYDAGQNENETRA